MADIVPYESVPPENRRGREVLEGRKGISGSIAGKVGGNYGGGQGGGLGGLGLEKASDENLLVDAPGIRERGTFLQERGETRRGGEGFGDMSLEQWL